MTSTIVRPRTGSAKWTRPRTAPQVTVVGQLALDQEMFVTGTPVPILNQDTSRSLNWPLARPRKSQERKSTAWRTDDELIEQVLNKITQDMESIKELFKYRDPYGDSIVTREGLFLITKSLIGHVTRDQFDSFLKRINLHWRSCISFDEFVFHLQDKLHSTKGINTMPSKDLQENHGIQVWSPFTKIPQPLVTLYSKLQKGEINIQSLLPVSCFHYGHIYKHQFKNALRAANLTVSDQDFQELWKKFEPDKYDAVSSKKFFTVFDLDHNGQPKSYQPTVGNSYSMEDIYKRMLDNRKCNTKMVSTSTKKQSSSVTVSKVDTVELHGDHVEILNRNDLKSTNSVRQKVITQMTTTTEEVNTTSETNTSFFEKRDEFQPSPYIQKLLQAKKSSPLFSDVVDHLHYKFEETYRNLEAAFKLFDFMNDGYIARIDFRRVLKEFGFDISAAELDTFLRGAGISVVQGLINYRQFLMKYQSKQEDGIMAKQKYQTPDSKYSETEEIRRAKEKENNIASFFHNDYMKLLEQLRQKDKNSTGIVRLHELRQAVNSVLGISMTDDQFNKLIKKLDQKVINNALINYETFLELFKSVPGTWNQHKNGSYVRQKYLLGEIAPPTPVLSLVEKSKTWMAPIAEKKISGNSKLLEIHQKLTKLFTDRFHMFDKNFQSMDSKKSGFMTKWQLGALLKLSGITLSVKDLDVLWSALDTSADDTLSYVTLVKTFTLKNQKTSQKGDSSPVKQVSRVSAIAKKKSAASSLSVSQSQVITENVKQKKLSELVHKIKDEILSRWDVLMSIFLSKDKNGYSSISVDEMKDICSKMKFSLTLSEINELCDIFDIHSNGWFHYLAFLHSVKKHSNEASLSPYVFNIHTKHLHRKAGPTSMAITIYDFLSELKNILLLKYKTLRGSFKFFDLNHNGFIEENELKKSLVMLGYNLSDQDFIDIFHIFDICFSIAIGLTCTHTHELKKKKTIYWSHTILIKNLMSVYRKISHSRMH
ncbi:hypothetical protein Btru_052350 [Bulinus truncatus]|nr:hypothetical protein Btru_052350 [Bulinus truncatus]